MADAHVVVRRRDAVGGDGGGDCKSLGMDGTQCIEDEISDAVVDGTALVLLHGL